MIPLTSKNTYRQRWQLLVATLLAWCGTVPGLPSAVHADDSEGTAESSMMETPLIDPGFEVFLEQHPNLCRGGAEFFLTSKKWIAIGVGRVAFQTEDGHKLSISDATKLARVKANRDLASLIHGFRMSAQDKSVMKSVERDGRTEILELFHSTSTQSIEASLNRVEVVGTWQLDKGGAIAVMVAVGDPHHPLFNRTEIGHSLVKLRNEQWKDDWKNVFAARPAIANGGASVYRTEDTTWILAVGKARLKGDPVMDRQSQLVASSNAASEAVQLINGLKISSQSIATQNTRRLTADETTLAYEVSETLNKTGSEKVSAKVRLNTAVGTWESDDGSFYFQAIAFKLSDL